MTPSSFTSLIFSTEVKSSWVKGGTLNLIGPLPICVQTLCINLALCGCDDGICLSFPREYVPAHSCTRLRDCGHPHTHLADCRLPAAQVGPVKLSLSLSLSLFYTTNQHCQEHTGPAEAWWQWHHVKCLLTLQQILQRTSQQGLFPCHTHTHTHTHPDKYHKQIIFIMSSSCCLHRFTIILLPPVPAPKIIGIDPELLKVHPFLLCYPAWPFFYMNKIIDSSDILARLFVAFLSQIYSFCFLCHQEKKL